MGKLVGIDLGTTNSCVAVVEGLGAPVVLGNDLGAHTTPSIVGISDEGDRLVGQIAKRQAITNPENTIFAVKRLIGRKLADPAVQRAIQSHLPYSLVEAGNGDLLVQVRGELYSPQEVSAILLRELKRYAEEDLGEEITEAIITVPAYFDDSQRQATKDAGRLAGLEVRRIINEPTAAALAYGLGGGQGGTIAVYDLGGGTFDISILGISEGIFEVRATNGDPDLGGEDFDCAIMDWLVEEFESDTGIDLRTDRMALQRLKEAAESAKTELSSSDEAHINLPFISSSDEAPLHLETSLSRDVFERLVKDLVARTEGPCRDALEQADLRPDEIDQVLLVGGQTRSPIVIAAVEKIFEQEPNRDVNPDEVVAIGAAIQGAILDGGIKDVVLLDVTPLSLGIETQGGLFTRLISRNSTLPTKVTRVFTTVMDNQDEVEIHILQGERELANENRSLGRIDLVGIPPAPRGFPQIEVTFSIDSNSIHTVSAQDKESKRSQTLQVHPASGLSEAEIERLIDEAKEFADQDLDRRELRVKRNRLTGLIGTTEKVYQQFSEVLADADRKKARFVLRAARSAASSDNQDKLETAMYDLESVAVMLSGAMLGETTED